MSKKALIGSIATFALGLLLIVFARDISETITTPFLADESPTQTIKIGHYEDVQGLVYLKPNSAGREIRLSERLPLRHLDQIRTESSASVIVTLDSASEPLWRVQILGGSTVIFESYRPSVANSPILLSLVRGDYQVLQEGKSGGLFISRNKKIFVPQNKPTPQMRTVELPAPATPGTGLAATLPVNKPEALPNEAPKTVLPSAKKKGPMPDKLPIGDEETLSSGYIESVLTQEAASFRRCQMNSVRDNRASLGSLLVSLTIQDTGHVQEARVLQNQMKNETLSQCVLSAIKRVKFKAFEGLPITLTYPIEFK